MTATELDICSTLAILRQTLARVDERGEGLAPWLRGPAVFLGCGSSYCIALAAAALYEDARGVPAQGIMASEYRPRPGWTHVATATPLHQETSVAATVCDAHRHTARLGDDDQQRAAGVDGQRRHQKANLAPCDGGQARARATYEQHRCCS